MIRLSALSLALLATSFLSLQAQTIRITDVNGTVVNGGTVTMTGASTATVLEEDLHVENIGVSGRTINVKRYEINVATGSRNYFCWGVCYNAIYAGTQPVWVSQHPLNLVTDSIYQNFHAYHMPMGTEAINTYRYVWYDQGNANDSTWVDIVFDTQAVGINEANNGVATFSMFPNPSTGNVVTVNYAVNGPTNGLSLELFNALGERVMVKGVEGTSGQVVLSTAGLPGGMYFASLVRNGQLLSTRRVVIASR